MHRITFADFELVLDLSEEEHPDEAARHAMHEYASDRGADIVWDEIIVSEISD